MLKLLQYLIYGHYHQYEIINTININEYINGQKVVVGTKWILQCKHCGNLKEFRSVE